MRITLGGGLAVQQTERWFSEMRAGRTFSRGGNVSPGAAAFAEIQLFNPAGSGVTVLVYRLLAGAGANDATQIRTFNTALTTLVGTGINLLAGGAAAVAEIRTNNPAALDGTQVSQTYAPANVTFERVDVWSWELGAAEGIIIAAGAVNISLAAEFYWNEI